MSIFGFLNPIVHRNEEEVAQNKNNEDIEELIKDNEKKDN